MAAGQLTTTAVAGIGRLGPRAVAMARGAPLLPSLILGSVVFVAVFADLLAPHDPLRPVKPGDLTGIFAPAIWADCVETITGEEVCGSWDTPMGTDFQGRDVLSRLIHGARVSLIVATVGTLFAGVLGTTLGIVAGYLGKWWDQVIMRITDAMLALPTLVFAIFLATVLRPNLWNIVLILGIVFWSRYTRVIRGEVLSLRERDFVKLAEANGASKARVMFKHLLPNVMNTVMVLFSLTVGIAIIIEASLSFLGVGVPEPTPTWGNMLADARPTLIFERWTLTVAPGVCIALIVLAVNLFGDWLRVRLDPQLRNR